MHLAWLSLAPCSLENIGISHAWPNLLPMLKKFQQFLTTSRKDDAEMHVPELTYPGRPWRSGFTSWGSTTSFVVFCFFLLTSPNTLVSSPSFDGPEAATAHVNHMHMHWLRKCDCGSKHMCMYTMCTSKGSGHVGQVLRNSYLPQLPRLCDPIIATIMLYSLIFSEIVQANSDQISYRRLSWVCPEDVYHKMCSIRCTP